MSEWKFICSQEYVPLDVDLLLRIHEIFDEYFLSDPYHICDCGHEGNHDSECVVELMNHDYVMTLYKALGGKFAKITEYECGNERKEIIEEYK
jgi:hypothetical protein